MKINVNDMKMNVRRINTIKLFSTDYYAFIISIITVILISIYLSLLMIYNSNVESPFTHRSNTQRLEYQNNNTNLI